MARLQIPKFTWGTAYANTLNIGYQLDSVLTSSRKRKGSERVRGQDGSGDAWDNGDEYLLEGIMRWIPAANTATPLATGWDGATGVDAFLRWAWDPTHQPRFFPDKGSGTFLTCYLDMPDDFKPGLEADGTKQVRLILRSLTTAFTGF